MSKFWNSKKVKVRQCKESKEMKEKMKRLLAVAVPLLMGLTLFTAVAYGAYLLGGVYATVGYIGFNVMVGVWLFREITRAPMMDD